VADDLAQPGELRDGVVDPGLVLDRARVPAIQASGAGLERREALRLPFADQLRRARVGVDANALAGRAAEQLVDRDAEQLAFDVPERLIDPAQSARQDRPAPVE